MLNKVREKRNEREMTQQNLAEVCGVSRQTIISIESSKYEPSARLALKLAKSLKCKVEELFQLEGKD